MSKRSYVLACGVTGTGCAECDGHINESVRTMEVNVDFLDRGVNAYILSRQDGISRCSKHGSDFYRKTKGQENTDSDNTERR